MEIKLDMKELLSLIPKESKKSVLYCEVEKSSYEAFFYSFYDDGKCIQSNELVDQGFINDYSLEEAVEKLVKEVRELSCFDSEKRNVVSAVIEGMTVTWELEQFEKTVGLYKIKKEWKLKYGCNPN